MIDIPAEMAVGRPVEIDNFEGVVITTQTFSNPPSEFVDAIRLCVINKVGCSFMPKMQATVEILEMQETTDRGGKHELWVAYRHSAN